MTALIDDVEIEDASSEDDEENIPTKYSISSYGADYVIDGLVRRILDGSIYVPSFQRNFVWDSKKASRFIESLLLGLPVPGIFLSKEEKSQKLLVIDGQQRLRTLEYFYEGAFGDTGLVFALRGVQEQFDGVTYKTLREEDKRRLDDSILHATIVKQDEPSDNDSSIYQIFERLNTGGVLLLPQEIRACIYHGQFSDALKELNTNQAWRTVFGSLPHKNMRDQELILRFLALYFSVLSYKKPMNEFLNSYMHKNRDLTVQSKAKVTSAFVSTIEVVSKCLGNGVFRPKRALNAAVFDAVMVGIARRLERGQVDDCETLQHRYDRLLRACV